MDEDDGENKVAMRPDYKGEGRENRISLERIRISRCIYLVYRMISYVYTAEELQ